MEIRTRQDFEAAVEAECLIVITDSATGNKVHRSDCKYVTPENFAEKVVKNGGRNGRYYVIGSVARAGSLRDAVPCSACAPS